MSDFDPSHDWDTFRVYNATTALIEYAEMNRSESFIDSDCHIYGYPFLALRICIMNGVAPNALIIGQYSF